MHADGGGRQREEGTPGQEKPWPNRELIAQVEDGKGGATGLGKADTGSREELLGMPSRGRKRRREVEAGRRGRRPDGQSLCAWAKWGERSDCKEREKRRRQVNEESGMQMVEVGRERKGPLDGITLGPTGT